MKREKVLKVMKHPYRMGTMTMPEGEVMELLYYHTDLKRDDGVETDDELTSIVLINDRGIGWGWILL